MKTDAILVTAGEIVVNRLRQHQVSKVFGIVGSHVTGIYDALADHPEIEVVMPKHEIGAALMAVGYARVSQQIGVCITTAGPGVLNATNGIGQAMFSSLPFLLIAGGVPTAAAAYELHGLEERSAIFDSVQPLVKFAARVERFEDIGPTVSEAISQAQVGRPGPSYVEIPWDLFAADRRGADIIGATPMEHQISLSNLDIDDACRALKVAAHPVLVLDKPTLHLPETSELVSVAERKAVPIAVTRDAIGVVPHTARCFAGVFHDHFFGHFAAEKIEDADVCVLVGFDNGSEFLEKARSIANGRIFEVGTTPDPGNLANNVNWKDALGRLCDAVGEREQRMQRSGASARNAYERVRASLKRNGCEESLQFGSMLRELADRLPNDAVSVIDAGSHEVWARTILPVTGPDSIIGGGNWGTMGYAVPVACGVRTARPTTRIACITGDGCLLMSMMDLPTLIEIGGPTLIVNLNDSEYGMMTQVQEKAYGRAFGSKLHSYDFAAIAEQFGATAFRVTNAEELDISLDAGFASEEPVFLDIIVKDSHPYPRL